MPVLRFKPGRVEEALGLPLAEALKLVERLKVEAEVVEDGYVELEVEVDRPDMYSLEGIARQAAGLLGREKGLVRYETIDSGYTIYASKVEPRPYIAGAVVWNVNVDEDFLEELIQFQEKLHGSLGSARQRMAIGLHDLDKLPSRELRYTMERIDDVKFVPLGGSEEMTLRRVLEETSQGRSYGSIALRDDTHPVLRSGDRVISVPPVINAEDTRIEPGTRHIFIDVTGTDLNVVLDTLSIIASSLAERGGRRIGLVRV
ncbi:MAG: phenylalanine--tRNA ligase subunit beta, partial [Crenarchaeota archaeon]|nr:phenylalanine--tRNA ligase subunit beta [Thermoproteota archaeon]